MKSSVTRLFQNLQLEKHTNPANLLLINTFILPDSGEVHLYKSILNNKLYLLKKIKLNEEKEMENLLRLNKIQLKIPNETMCNVVSLTCNKTRHLCSAEFEINTFYEFFESNLKKEVINRSKNSQKFPGSYLVQFLSDIFQNMKYLKRNDIPLPFLCLEKCLIETGNPSIKLLNIVQDRNYQNLPRRSCVANKRLLNEDIYASPNSLEEDGNTRHFDRTFEFMYSACLLILEIGNLHSIQNIYTDGGLKIDFNALAVHLSNFRKQYDLDVPNLTALVSKILRKQISDVESMVNSLSLLEKKVVQPMRPGKFEVKAVPTRDNLNDSDEEVMINNAIIPVKRSVSQIHVSDKTFPPINVHRTNENFVLNTKTGYSSNNGVNTILSDRNQSVNQTKGNFVPNSKTDYFTHNDEKTIQYDKNQIINQTKGYFVPIIKTEYWANNITNPIQSDRNQSFNQTNGNFSPITKTNYSAQNVVNNIQSDRNQSVNQLNTNFSPITKTNYSTNNVINTIQSDRNQSFNQPTGTLQFPIRPIEDINQKPIIPYKNLNNQSDEIITKNEKQNFSFKINNPDGQPDFQKESRVLQIPVNSLNNQQNQENVGVVLFDFHKNHNLIKPIYEGFDDNRQKDSASRQKSPFVTSYNLEETDKFLEEKYKQLLEHQKEVIIDKTVTKYISQDEVETSEFTEVLKNENNNRVTRTTSQVIRKSSNRNEKSPDYSNQRL